MFDNLKSAFALKYVASAIQNQIGASTVLNQSWQNYLKALVAGTLAGVLHSGVHIWLGGKINWSILVTVGAVAWTWVSDTTEHPLPTTPPWDGIERRNVPAGPSTSGTAAGK
jgi:hypothetical protein